MSTSWDDCRPETDDEAYLVPLSNERRQLLEKIATNCERRIRPELWAFLQVCDLAQIRILLSSLHVYDELRQHGTLDGYRLRYALLLWMQRRVEKTDTGSAKRTHSDAFSSDYSPSPRPSSSKSPTSVEKTRSKVPPGTPEGIVRRDDKVAEPSKQRDGNMCVITKMSAVDACHIYPWCAFEDSNRVRSFWTTLRFFWTKEKVDAWQAKIFPPASGRGRGRETIMNMFHGDHTRVCTSGGSRVSTCVASCEVWTGKWTVRADFEMIRQRRTVGPSSASHGDKHKAYA